MQYTLILVGPSGVEFSRSCSASDHTTLNQWRGLPESAQPVKPRHGRAPTRYYVWKDGEEKTVLEGAGAVAAFFSMSYPTVRAKIKRSESLAAPGDPPIAKVGPYNFSPVREYDLITTPSLAKA